MGTQANPLQHGISVFAGVLLSVAALWDLAGAMVLAPPWWPLVSHATAAAGIASGCAAVLLRLFDRRLRRRRSRGTPLQLIALGLMLLAWLLRGHRGIPADPPIVAAEAAAAALYLRAIHRARDPSQTGPGSAGERER